MTTLHSLSLIVAAVLSQAEATQTQPAKSAAPRAVTPFSPAKSDLVLNDLKPARVELVSSPNMSRELATFQTQGYVAEKDYVPTNPLMVPLVKTGEQPYKIVAGALRVGALPYTDRGFKITELSDALRGLTLLQTKMGHKGIVDGRFSIVLSSQKPCYLFVAFRGETLNTYSHFGTPAWLEEFSSTDFSIVTDNPIRGTYQVFVKQVPAGRFTLGPCCSDPLVSSMYFAIAAEAN